MIQGYHMIPNDPAVIPTATKKLNSKRSLAPGGIDINILLKNNRADGSIEIDICS